jgi:XTP/dITP diphosphohydrolase
MSVILIASDNRGKLSELSAMLSGSSAKLVPQSEFGITSAEETGTSFSENAHIKALHAARESGHPALSDDSGLCVDALGGRPGIHSARYSGISAELPEERDRANIQKLLDELAGVPEKERTAHFCCALALVWPPGTVSSSKDRVYVGKWSGRILESPSAGTHGFGYDPVFYIEEKACSAAELLPEEKHRISHRARAWAQLLPYMRECGL